MLESTLKEEILKKKCTFLITEERNQPFHWKAIIGEFSVEKSGRAHGSYRILSSKRDDKRCVMLNKAIKLYNNISI